VSLLLELLLQVALMTSGQVHCNTNIINNDNQKQTITMNVLEINTISLRQIAHKQSIAYKHLKQKISPH